MRKKSEERRNCVQHHWSALLSLEECQGNLRCELCCEEEQGQNKERKTCPEVRWSCNGAGAGHGHEGYNEYRIWYHHTTLFMQIKMWPNSNKWYGLITDGPICYRVLYQFGREDFGTWPHIIRWPFISTHSSKKVQLYPFSFPPQCCNNW